MQHVRGFLTAVLAVAMLGLCLATASAQQGLDLQQLAKPLEDWQGELDRVEMSLAKPDIDDATLARLREVPVQVRSGAEELAKTASAQLQSLRSQLNSLGPPPKPEDPPEPETAAKQRQQLSTLVSELDGIVRTAAVLQTRAEQLADAVQERRRTLFQEKLLERAPSPFSLELWRQVSRDAGAGLFSLQLLFKDWWQGLQTPAWLAAALAAALAVWAALKALCRPAIARLRPAEEAAPPSLLRRAASAAAVIIARALPPVAAAGVLHAVLSGGGLLPGRMAPLAVAALEAFASTAVLIVLVVTLLEPRRPQWRIIPAADAAAARLAWLAGAMAVVYGLDIFLAELNRILAAPLALTIAQTMATTAALVVLLAAILRTPLASDGAEAAPRGASAAWIRLALWLLVLAIAVAAVLGYVALARFLAAGVVTTGALLILIYLLHLAIEELSSSLADPGTAIGRWAASRMALSGDRAEQAGIALSLLLHLVLAVVAAPLLLVLWGVDWMEVRSGLERLLFGFQFGEWRISLATIVAALVLFIAGLVATRLFQHWLDARVMQRAKFQQGARSAIRSLVGYVGVVMAAVIAFSYTGLDLSNLALIAGALGVGIGFGLQSIVNNFVSGLILLAERRISVGDWIVVGAEEGHVRRISVRATEIETFDRNYVIIPNSELITHTVKNWTFRHRRARVVIPVGVSYASDPEQVRDILLECAHAHPDTLEAPPPRVLFDDFGDSALAFRLIAFVPDVDRLILARSELRFAILKRFREEGIEIPFPQQDVHLKDIERLERALLGRPGGDGGEASNDRGKGGRRAGKGD